MLTPEPFLLIGWGKVMHPHETGGPPGMNGMGLFYFRGRHYRTGKERGTAGPFDLSRASVEPSIVVCFFALLGRRLVGGFGETTGTANPRDEPPIWPWVKRP